MNKSNNIAQPADNQLRTYEAPALTDFGLVCDLTAGGSAGKSEFGTPGGGGQETRSRT